MPIVRTYIPVAAGVGKMPYGHFVRYNVIGALAWGVGVTMLGFWLGNFEFVRDHIEGVLILVVLVSLIPISIEWLRSRLEKRKERKTVA